MTKHTLLQESISDRDKLFTSKFGKVLITQLNIKHKLSTAYYPQTDGQTECINQILEEYLRYFCDY